EKPPAVQRMLEAVFLLEGIVAAGLVVPDGETPVARLVDAVDLALEQESASGCPDLDGIRRAERLVPARPLEAERDLEPARRRAGVLAFGPEEDVARGEELAFLRPQGREVRGRDQLLPAREPLARDGPQPRGVPSGVEPEPFRAERGHEVVERLVEEVPELPRV